MRESLYEKLKKKEVNYLNTLMLINKLFDSRTNNLYAKFLRAFDSTVFNAFYPSFSDALLDVLELDNEYISYNTFSGGLNEAKINGANVTLDSFLDYMELFMTVSNKIVGASRDSAVEQIDSIVKMSCDKLGYKLVYQGKIYKVMIKDEIAEATALYQKDETRDKIYRYLMLRQGDITYKRECLKSLADDVELLCDRASVKEINKVKEFIQCIRHTKDDNGLQKKFPFYYKNEEDWLDKSFKMMIGVLSFTAIKEYVKEIISLQSSGDGE